MIFLELIQRILAQPQGRHAQARSQTAAAASELQSLSATSSPRPNLVRSVHESSRNTQSPNGRIGQGRVSTPRGGYRGRGASGGFGSRGGFRGGRGGGGGRGRGRGQRGERSGRGSRARSSDDSYDFDDMSAVDAPDEQSSADIEAIEYLERRREEIHKKTRSLKVYEPEDVDEESLVPTGPGVEGSFFGVKAAVQEGMRQVANRRAGQFVGGRGLSKRVGTREWVLFEDGEREELAEFRKGSRHFVPESLELQGIKEEEKTQTLNKLVAGHYPPVTEKGTLGILQTKLRANPTYTEADSNRMLDKIRELLPQDSAKKPAARR